MTRLSRQEAEDVQRRLTRELDRSMEQVMHYRQRDQSRYYDERFHALRHRDSGAPWDVNIT
jgi:hypothetical protein